MNLLHVAKCIIPTIIKIYPVIENANRNKSNGSYKTAPKTRTLYTLYDIIMTLKYERIYP